MRDTYTHGHHDSVLRSHRWRTLENSAAYLSGYLERSMALLDVGCGPGTITADFARRLDIGTVVGIDAEPSVLEEARATNETILNLRFAPGNVYELAFDDNSFDVVHAHQVLQHLTDPVAALAEMRRVTKSGGIIAVRDCDYRSFLWCPLDRRLDRWLQLYRDVARRNGAEPDAGRFLPAWLAAAGLVDLHVTGSLWTFSDEPSRRWWGGLWEERVEHSAFAEQALANSLSSRDELAQLASAWRDWRNAKDAFFAVPHVEVIAFK